MSHELWLIVAVVRHNKVITDEVHYWRHDQFTISYGFKWQLICNLLSNLIINPY